MDFAGLQERIQPFMDQGRYEQAINECLKVWRDNKDNVELSLLIGRLYHRAGNAQEAKCFFTIAGKHANGDTGVLRRVEMFKRATALLPNSRTDIENFCDPDIVLVQAPGWGVDIPPLATAMLTSFARKHGYKVLPIDLNIEIYLTRPPEFDKAWDSEQAQWFWNTNELVKKMITLLHEKIDAFVELLITTNTPMVGFTLYSSSKFMSLALARMLKTRQPNLQIVFGGPHVSRYMEGQTIIGNPFIDAVVQGEGELTLIDFMERVKIGAAFFVKTCPQTKSDLKVGRQVVFADDTVRTIVRINENDDSLIVILDGTPLDGNVVGYPKEIRITVAAETSQRSDIPSLKSQQ
jgi:hypothetical protein